MRQPILALSVLSTALVACGDAPPTPTEVRGSITDDLGYILREAVAAKDGSTANLPSGSAFGFATSVLDSTGATARLLAPLTDRVSAKHRQGVDEEQPEPFDADAFTKRLNDELFTDANYLGDGIYKVPASLVCTTTTVDPTTMMSIEMIDPDCAASLEKVQLRIRVASEDDTIRFFIQVDPDHDEPLSLLLGHDTLAVTANLDEASAAMISLAQLLGEEAPNAALAGQVTASIKIFGHAHARIGLVFDRPLSIKFAEQSAALDGPGAFRMTSAAAHVVSVELNANTPAASLNFGLGETTVHTPGDEFDPETDVVLGGATVNATFQNNTLSLADLSLGNRTTTVSVAGQQAVAIDLNPADGRKLNATITVDPVALTETLAVSPKLDLQYAIDHAVLGDEAPVYDVTRVLLLGSLRGTEGSDQVEVVSGSFSITTNPAQYGFAASAGQCVTGIETYDDATLSSYTTYSVGACI